MYRLLFCLMVFMVSQAHATTNFGAPSTLQEVQQHFGAGGHGPFIVSGCAPTVPASSLTIAAFACTAVVHDASTPPREIPVVQDVAGVDRARFGDRLAGHRLHVMSAPRRQAGPARAAKRTHYVYQASATPPANPTGGRGLCQSHRGGLGHLCH
jgi:hypothetical protein